MLDDSLWPENRRYTFVVQALFYRDDYLGYVVFDSAELVVGICAQGCGDYSRKQLDGLTDFVKKPQIIFSGNCRLNIFRKYTTKKRRDQFYFQNLMDTTIQ